MKVIKFLAMLLVAFTLGFSVTSCGDDDEIGAIGKPSVEFTKKTATELEITAKTGYGTVVVWNAKFDSNQKVSRITNTTTYATVSAAKIAYEALKADVGVENVSINEKTVTADMTKENENSSYDEVLRWFEMLFAGYKEAEN